MFSCPPPCQPGWPAFPCTCNGLWLHSRMPVFSKRSIVRFFVTDQTPRPYPTRSLPAQFWHRCTERRNKGVSTKPLITKENWPGRGLNPGLPNDTPALAPPNFIYFPPLPKTGILARRQPQTFSSFPDPFHFLFKLHATWAEINVDHNPENRTFVRMALKVLF
jgi:hypothetical protein